MAVLGTEMPNDEYPACVGSAVKWSWTSISPGKQNPRETSTIAFAAPLPLAPEFTSVMMPFSAAMKASFVTVSLRGSSKRPQCKTTRLASCAVSAPLAKSITAHKRKKDIGTKVTIAQGRSGISLRQRVFEIVGVLTIRDLNVKSSRNALQFTRAGSWNNNYRHLAPVPIHRGHVLQGEAAVFTL